MKISQTTPILNTTTGSTPSPGGKARVPAQPVAAELQSTSVRRALQESADVDMDKVREVRLAIARGDLALDPDLLAEAVLDMHQR